MKPLSEADVRRVATGSQCVCDGLGREPYRFVACLDAPRWALAEVDRLREELAKAEGAKR